MINQTSEKKMHYIRWVLLIAWLTLITSFFYDPISHHLSDPGNVWSPFHDITVAVSDNPALCVRVQGDCLPQQPYPMGSRIFWGMVVPSAVAIVFVLGHVFWRRICPLYFVSQIPRALGLQPKLQINKNTWLQRNHFYLQFALLFIGLNFRILFINSNRIVFGSFLLLTIFSAITVVWLYGGRSWCHYVCPFGMVQTVFTGPRGLLDSKAHDAPPKTITQSMCRTIDPKSGREISACISCKSACLDIDSEKSYWSNLEKPGRKLVQYGYLGLVVGYIAYYFLYAGNFKYYFSGVWTHEANQIGKIFDPGFYILNNSVLIPKLVAVPLTFMFFVVVSCLICSYGEKALYSFLKRRNSSINRQHALHLFFSLCTFAAFNIFFLYAGRPEILRLPMQVQWTFNDLVILVSTLWLYRTWNRSFELYTQESMANKLRRQLKKLSIDWSELLEGRSIDTLTPNETYVLAKVLPGATQKDRCTVYQGVLIEALEEERFTPADSGLALAQLRKRLQLSDSEHEQILNKAISLNPALLNISQSQNNIRQSLKHSAEGLIRLGNKQESSHKDSRILAAKRTRQTGIDTNMSDEPSTQLGSKSRTSDPDKQDFSPTIEIKD